MKTMKTIAVTSAITMAALSVAAGAAAADAPVAADGAPGIHYTADVVDRSVVLHTDAGRVTLRDNQFQILDDNGNLAFGMPLSYRLDHKDWPITAQIDAGSRTATLTPGRNPATAVASSAPEPKPIFSQDDFNDALGVAANQIGLATGLGVLVGTALGLTGGCVAGALVGTALMPPLFLAGAPGGCLAGAAAGAALGAAAGTVAVGGPVAVISLIQMFNSLTNPQN